MSGPGMAVTVVLAVWAFSAWGMLWWAGAAAIPLIIHLWSKRRYREVPWAAMQFLLAALRQNARRIRVEQLILLAIRMVILILFAVALADPRWRADSPGAAGHSESRTHEVLVLDVSYSMGTLHGTRSQLETAKERARELVQAARRGDGFSLVLLGNPPRVIVDAPAFDTAQVLLEIDDVELQQTGAELLSTLAQVTPLVQIGHSPNAGRGPAGASQAKHSEPPAPRVGNRFTRRRVTFFSDLAANTWDAATSDQGRGALEQLAALAELRLEHVGGPPVLNLAVTSLRSSVPFALLDQRVELTAEVRNFGAESLRLDRVRWTVDGVQAERGPVDPVGLNLAPGGSVTLRAAFSWSTPGDHLVELSLPNDPLELDNHRRICVPVIPRLRGLILEGGSDSGAQLAKALEASESPERSAFQVTRRPYSRFAQTDLAEFDFVVLSDVARFVIEDRDRLAAFLRRGGALLFAVGEQTDLQNYWTVLGAADNGGLLPVRPRETRSERTYFFSPLEYSHPIVAPFRGFERAGLLTAPTWKYVVAEPVAGARTALAFDTGDAALVERPVVGGEVLFLTTAAATTILDAAASPPRSWSAVAAWPSFPPLIQESIRYAIGATVANRNVLVGEPLRGRYRGTAERESLLVTLPDGTREPLIPRSSGLRPEEPGLTTPFPTNDWSFAETLTSGIYRVSADGTDAIWRYAVNVDTRESDPLMLDPDALPPSFAMRSASDELRPTNETPEGQPWFRYLLLAVVGLLVAESWMARRVTGFAGS